MKRFLITSLILLLGLTLFGGAPKEKEGREIDLPLKIGAIFISKPGDFGYSYMTDLGLMAAEEHFKDDIEITRVENVTGSDECIDKMQMLIDEGNSLIIANSYEHMNYMKEVADNNPDVYFENCSGYISSENMHNYYGRMYQMRYLTGMIAGAMAKNGKIGYVASFDTPEVIRGINAFTLGARSINPNAEVLVEWTNTWYEPSLERRAADSLLDRGVDVIAQHQDSTQPALAAIERNKYAIGYNADFGELIGDERILVSSVWNWENYFIPVIESIMNGTWNENDKAYWGGIEDGIVSISKISPLVPSSVKSKVKDAYSKMKDGSFDVFWGEIRDNEGKIRQEKGEKMSDEEMLSLDWLVEGVIIND